MGDVRRGASQDGHPLPVPPGGQGAHNRRDVLAAAADQRHQAVDEYDRRDVSEAIRRNDHLQGTASPETIRRMLLGITVPVRWATVEAVYLTLCDLAGEDPYQQRHWDGDYGSIRSFVENAWHSALDNPDRRSRQPARTDSAEFVPPERPPGWDDDDF